MSAQWVVPWGVVLQLVAMQLTLPAVPPLTIPTEMPLTEKVFCQSSEQLPPFVQVAEQLYIVSGGEIVPVLSVVHVAAVGSCPQPLLVAHAELVQERCSCTVIPESWIGFLLALRTW